MFNDEQLKIQKEYANQLIEDEKYKKEFPLSEYSTNQLKQELKRRKKG